jgi:hypothetical protein
MLKRWGREPLVQFLAIGALLFLVFEWRGAGPASRRIVITPGQVDALASGFARTWQRPPTEQEIKGLIDEHVREEIATREAMAQGLDRDDTVIRRRLRQKLEFLTEDSAETVPPTEAELRAWLEAHPGQYWQEPEIAFEQAIEGAAGLRMLPPVVDRSTRGDVARVFGEDFAASILTVEPGRWAGPIKSAYGEHRVLVRERHDGRMPSLDEVRPQVERDFVADRRRRQLEASYEQLLERYQIVIERRPEGGTR